MHRTQGPDQDGSNRYKETNPATVINANAMNALQEEVAGAVEGAGLTLRATGALDQAGSWGQLKEAIARTYTLPAEWRVGIDRTIFHTANVKVTVFALRKLVHYDIPPAFGVTLPLDSGADPTYIDITAASDAGFPVDLYPPVSSQHIYDNFVRVNDNLGNHALAVYQTRSERIFRIVPFSGSDFPAGSQSIGGIRLTSSLF